MIINEIAPLYEAILGTEAYTLFKGGTRHLDKASREHHVKSWIRRRKEWKMFCEACKRSNCPDAILEYRERPEHGHFIGI